MAFTTRFGKKSETAECRFGATCTKVGCSFSHPVDRKEPIAKDINACSWKANCTDRTCTKTHPADRKEPAAPKAKNHQEKKTCTWGVKCTNKACTYGHPAAAAPFVSCDKCGGMMIRDAIGNFPKCDCETICDAVGELLDLDAFANDDHCEVADEDADLEGDALGDNDESVWIDGVQIDLRSPVESIAPIVPVAHRPFVFSLAKK